MLWWNQDPPRFPQGWKEHLALSQCLVNSWMMQMKIIKTVCNGHMEATGVAHLCHRTVCCSWSTVTTIHRKGTAPISSQVNVQTQNSTSLSFHTESIHVQALKSNGDFNENSGSRGGDKDGGYIAEPTESHLQFLIRHPILPSLSSLQQMASPVSPLPPKYWLLISPLSILLSIDIIHSFTFRLFRRLSSWQVPQVTEPCPLWRLLGYCLCDSSVQCLIPSCKLFVRYWSQT